MIPFLCSLATVCALVLIAHWPAPAPRAVPVPEGRHVRLLRGDTVIAAERITVAVVRIHRLGAILSAYTRGAITNREYVSLLDDELLDNDGTRPGDTATAWLRYRLRIVEVYP